MIAILQSLTLVAIALNGVDFRIGGIDLNSERVLIPLILLALAGHALANRPIFVSKPAWLYFGWVLSVVTALLLAIHPVIHVNGLLISVAPFGYFLLFMQKGLSARRLNALLEIFLWIMSVASIAVFVLWTQSGLFPGLIDRGRIMLTMVEPNILGATLAGLMVMHLGSARIGARVVLVQLLSLGALLLTASKMPYAAYFAAILYLLFRSGVLRGVIPIMFMTSGVIVLVAMSVLLADSFQSLYLAVLDRPDAINNRMYGLTLGWERFLQRPFFGNGPLDFAFASPEILVRMGTDDLKNLWIWQIWVAVLHDEGLFGFVFFMAFLVTSWIRCERLIRSGQRQFMGYAAGMIAVLAASQTTTLHLSAIFGLVFGLANSKPEAVAALRATAARLRPRVMSFATDAGWRDGGAPAAPAIIASG